MNRAKDATRRASGARVALLPHGHVRNAGKGYAARAASTGSTSWPAERLTAERLATSAGRRRYKCSAGGFLRRMRLSHRRKFAVRHTHRPMCRSTTRSCCSWRSSQPAKTRRPSPPMPAAAAMRTMPCRREDALGCGPDRALRCLRGFQTLDRRRVRRSAEQQRELALQLREVRRRGRRARRSLLHTLAGALVTPTPAARRQRALHIHRVLYDCASARQVRATRWPASHGIEQRPLPVFQRLQAGALSHEFSGGVVTRTGADPSAFIT